jgi:hypothetical protein
VRSGRLDLNHRPFGLQVKRPAVWYQRWYHERFGGE